MTNLVLVPKTQVPQQAGKATLIFEERIPRKLVKRDRANTKLEEDSSCLLVPTRKEGLIRLPIRKGMKGHWLAGTQQFLVWYPAEARGGYWLHEEWYGKMELEDRLYLSAEYRRQSCWFGGTDQEPFLTELNPEVFKVFEDGGEDAFYQSLKPYLNVLLENAYGVESVRQGDIFATPMLMTGLEFLNTFSRNLKESGHVVPPSPSAGFSVLGTRHRVFGAYTENIPGISSFEMSDSDGNTMKIGRSCALAHGWLKAPDHEPVFLKGVHLLSQMEGLPSYESSYVAKVD